MKYGRIAGNVSINAAIYRCFEFITEADAKAFVRKFAEHTTGSVCGSPGGLGSPSPQRRRVRERFVIRQYVPGQSIIGGGHVTRLHTEFPQHDVTS